MEKDRPGVIAPPPAIFVIAFGVGWLLRNNFAPRAGSGLAGGILAVIGAAIITAALVTMLRARTNVDPYKPATALVTSGPFRFSRNPIYLSMTLLYIGAALSLRVSAPLYRLPIALVVLHYGVIRREE